MHLSLPEEKRAHVINRDRGAPRSKLILGIPFYGQAFTTSSTPTGAYRQDTAGPGKPGTWTKQRGMLAFYEICSKGGSQPGVEMFQEIIWHHFITLSAQLF